MNEREIVLSPEQYAELERELFEQRASKPLDQTRPQMVDMYPATNRKQRRAMKAHARRAAWAARKR